MKETTEIIEHNSPAPPANQNPESKAEGKKDRREENGGHFSKTPQGKKVKDPKSSYYLKPC